MVPPFAVLSVALLAAMASACTATSPEELAEIVDEARACQDGDVCELAGGGQCTCATPVNADAAARVDEAAADVDCEGAMVECVSHQNVRCEDGRCRSDESP
ncbi:MAG: hypothetical protein RIF41_17050 [Polyangiaceae bacterium]